MLKRLRRASAWFARVPSLAWGLIYLALIPLFGAWYNQHPGEFYHTTTMLEEGTAADRDEAEIAVSDSVRANYRAVNKTDVILIDGKADDITTFGPSFVYESLRDAVPRQVRAYREFDVVIRYTRLRMIVQRIPIADSPLFILRVEAVEPDGDIANSVSTVFPCTGARGVRSEGPMVGCLPMTMHDFSKIDVYVDDVNGLPQSYSHLNYFRMLYFSASTITTVGFGDILPISIDMRMLVTLEAVLGPIIVGLFLNSLVREGNDLRDSPK